MMTVASLKRLTFAGLVAMALTLSLNVGLSTPAQAAGLNSTPVYINPQPLPPRGGDDHS